MKNRFHSKYVRIPWILISILLLTAMLFIAVIATIVCSVGRNAKQMQRWMNIRFIGYYQWNFLRNFIISLPLYTTVTKDMNSLSKKKNKKKTENYNYLSHTQSLFVRQWPFLQWNPWHFVDNVLQPISSSLPSKQCFVPSHTNSSGKHVLSLMHLNSSFVHSVTSWCGT